jgi:hypothetical protein
MQAKHLVLLLACALGCEEVDAGDGGGTGGSSPTASDSDPSAESGDPWLIADCRETCDDLLFYDCLNADTHEACYDTCSDRGTQDIETFLACVQNTLPGCSECYENFADTDPPDPTTGSETSGPDTTGGPGETSGVSAGTCLDACEEYVGAGCNVEFSDVEFTSCDEFCDALSGTAQALVVECVAERDGCTLPDYCTMSSSGGG